MSPFNIMEGFCGCGVRNVACPYREDEARPVLRRRRDGRGAEMGAEKGWATL